MTNMLDILIPTYNRGSYLVKNLQLISAQLTALSKINLVRVIVVDNCSTDGSFELVAESLHSTCELKIDLFRNAENIGLYNNIIKVLSLARAPFIMYLGDDDYIPIDYWKCVLNLVERKEDVGFIKPVRREIDSAFQIPIPLETGNAKVKRFRRNMLSTLFLASNSNQLSGLVYRNIGLYDRVISEQVKNLYPFMALAGWVLRDFRGYTVLGCPLLITDGVKKDWGYGKDGTLGDILDNVKFFSDSYLKRIIGEAYFANRWKWFLSIVLRRGFSHFLICLKVLLLDKRLLVSSRLLLAYFCFYIQGRIIIHNFKRKLLPQTLALVFF